MAVDRKGFSTIIMIFIVLAITLVGVTWYRANISAGAGQQEQIGKQSQLDDLDYRLQNFLYYIRESIETGAQKGTNDLASDAGRSELGSRYRYWMCNSQPQVPTVEKLNESLFSGWYMDMNRLRFDLRSENSPISYLETLSGFGGDFLEDTSVENARIMEGFNSNFQPDPGNDRFQLTTEVDEIEVSVPGEGYRTVSDMELESNVTYNRFWYMYNTLKKWVMANNGRNLTDNVRRSIVQVPDVGRVGPEWFNPSPETWLIDLLLGFLDIDAPRIVVVQKDPAPRATAKLRCYNGLKDPKAPADIREQLNRSVYNGLHAEMNELEENPGYFDNNSVSCSFDFNGKWNDAGTQKIPYPGFRVEAYDDILVHQPQVMDLGTPADILPSDPFGITSTLYSAAINLPVRVYACTGWSWELEFESYLDYTVTCTDNKYRSSPGRENTEGVNWKIDLSYQVNEKSMFHLNDFQPDPYNSINLPQSFAPERFKACNVEEDNVPVEGGTDEPTEPEEWCQFGDTKTIYTQLGGGNQLVLTEQGEENLEGVGQVCKATSNTVIDDISGGNEWLVNNYYTESGSYDKVVIQDQTGTKRYERTTEAGITTIKRYDVTGTLAQRSVNDGSQSITYGYYPDCNLQQCSAGLKFQEFWQSNQSRKECYPEGDCEIPNCDTSVQRTICQNE